MKGQKHEIRKLALVPSNPEGGINHTSLPKILTSQRALQQFLEHLFSTRDQNIFVNLGCLNYDRTDNIIFLFGLP